jgi:hypothetical protein
VSLGSAIGVPFVAAELRITAAVFGLAGHETLAGAARRVTVPVEFLLQWDDELAPRDSSLALFDAFVPRERLCTPTPVATRAYPRSSWPAQRGSSAGISSKTLLRTSGNLHGGIAERWAIRRIAQRSRAAPHRDPRHACRTLHQVRGRDSKPPVRLF